MNDTYSAELYRQEGAEFRSVRLAVRSDGSLRLDAQDMGKLVEETWGDSDCEFWVDVPADFCESTRKRMRRNMRHSWTTSVRDQQSTGTPLIGSDSFLCGLSFQAFE
jgi:hypothetical protein